MSTHWNAQEVAAATGGMIAGEWVATSVSIDTRSLQPGALFVALVAERDGHAFVSQALAKGAVAAVVARPLENIDPAKLVIVPDTQAALQHLGEAARKRSTAKFVGITGSVGKTGAKEMLATALTPIGRVHATAGNLNNHLGVPMTLANMPLDTEFAIIEMGMNHAGEISPLSKMAQPHVALITTVDAVHIENFPDVAAIAEEKGCIFDGMCEGGVAVLNADNAHFHRLKIKAEARGVDRVLSFGAIESALCRLVHYRVSDAHSVIDATIAGTEVSYEIGTIGKHWAVASVAALAIVDALGGDLAVASAALKHFTEPKGRGRITQLAVKGGYLRLVDDSYNASPLSVTGAIEKMAEIRDSSTEKMRTVVVLGDMLELGDRAEDLHVGLMPAIINNQMDLLFAVGKFMQKLYDSMPEPMRGAYRPTSREMAPIVTQALRPRDLVLVKGSHGSHMEMVVEAIEENARSVNEKGTSDAI